MMAQAQVKDRWRSKAKGDGKRDPQVAKRCSV
jgi:hypothetical protein